MSGKKFTFPLANVLKLRQHELRQAQSTLDQVRRDLQAQDARLQDARARCVTCAAAAPQRGPFGPQILRQHDAFRRDAQRAYDEARRQLTYLQHLESQAKDQVIQKQRAEEILQTLYEQQKAAFQEAQQAAELSLLDEQALAGFNRKRQMAAR